MKKLLKMKTAFYLPLLASLVLSAHVYAEQILPEIQIETPALVSPQFKIFADSLLSYTSAGTGANNNGHLATQQVIEASTYTHQLQQTMNQMADVALVTASDHGITPVGATQMAMLIKANDAAMQAYAAEDALARHLIYAIREHYNGMTREQIIAELIEEGRSYGYIKDYPAKVAKNGFSIISPANAQAGGLPGISGMVALGAGDHKHTIPADCSKLTDGQFGPGVPGSGGSMPQEDCRSGIYVAKVMGIMNREPANISATPGHNGNGTGNPTAQGDVEIFDQLANVITNSPKSNKVIKNVTGNATYSGTTPSAENDIGSFFISRAHAQAGGGTSAFVQAAAQAQTSATQKNKDAHIGLAESTSELSGWELAHNNCLGDASSGSTMANKQEMRKMVDAGQRLDHCSDEQYKLLMSDD